MSCRNKCQRLSPQRLINHMKQFYHSHTNANKYNKMIQGAYSQFSKKDLRLDVTEWIETFSRDDASSSCFILTVIQRPGARDQQMLPQEFKSLKAACMDSTKLLSEVITECGARSISTEVRNDRFYVTTDNNVRITMVLD